MGKIANRSTVVLFLCAGLVIGVAVFFVAFCINAPQWVSFPGSPHIYTAGNLSLGTFTDREGNVLLSIGEERVYADDALLRQATVHYLGDRMGKVSAAALSNYACEIASYDIVNGVYAYSRSGATVRLTLHSKLQKAALSALSGKSGTVAVYNYQTGELLCAVTSPTFDPDGAQTEIDSMYLNRFTQGLYIPGSVFKTVTLAAVLEEMPDLQNRIFDCTGVYFVENSKITCEAAHGQQTLPDAFGNSCNCVFARLALALGAEKMTEYTKKFGVAASITFDGITTVPGNYAVVGESTAALALSGVGQGTDQINPCTFLSFIGAVAGGGQGISPHIVSEIRDRQAVLYKAQPTPNAPILSPKTAGILRDYLRNNVASYYGDGYFCGLTVCAKTGTAEVGGGKKPNAMLTGFAVDEAYPIAFIICVEDGGYGAQVCLPIAQSVLQCFVDNG